MTNNKSRHFYQAILSPLAVAVVVSLFLWGWNSSPIQAQSTSIRYVAQDDWGKTSELLML